MKSRILANGIVAIALTTIFAGCAGDNALFVEKMMYKDNLCYGEKVKRGLTQIINEHLEKFLNTEDLEKKDKITMKFSDFDVADKKHLITTRNEYFGSVLPCKAKVTFYVGEDSSKKKTEEIFYTLESKQDKLIVDLDLKDK